jgi:hypothetical protein
MSNNGATSTTSAPQPEQHAQPQQRLITTDPRLKPECHHMFTEGGILMRPVPHYCGQCHNLVFFVEPKRCCSRCNLYVHERCWAAWIDANLALARLTHAANDAVMAGAVAAAAAAADLSSPAIAASATATSDGVDVVVTTLDTEADVTVTRGAPGGGGDVGRSLGEPLSLAATADDAVAGGTIPVTSSTVGIAPATAAATVADINTLYAGSKHTHRFVAHTLVRPGFCDMCDKVLFVTPSLPRGPDVSGALRGIEAFASQTANALRNVSDRAVAKLTGAVPPAAARTATVVAAGAVGTISQAMGAVANAAPPLPEAAAGAVDALKNASSVAVSTMNSAWGALAGAMPAVPATPQGAFDAPAESEAPVGVTRINDFDDDTPPAPGTPIPSPRNFGADAPTSLVVVPPAPTRASVALAQRLDFQEPSNVGAASSGGVVTQPLAASTGNSKRVLICADCDHRVHERCWAAQPPEARAGAVIVTEAEYEQELRDHAELFKEQKSRVMSDTSVLLKLMTRRNKGWIEGMINPLTLYRVQKQQAQIWYASIGQLQPSARVADSVLSEASDVLRYATAVYGRSFESGFFGDTLGSIFIQSVRKDLTAARPEHNNLAVMNVLALPRSALVSSRWGRAVSDPSYVVILDESTRRIVLAFRGTLSEADAMTDLVGTLGPFCGGHAHSGIVAMIDSLFDEATCPLLPQLRGLLMAHPGFRLVVTGHSLGGGITALFTLRSVYQDALALPDGRRTRDVLRAYAFAPPPVATDPLASTVDDVLVSVVAAKDVVSRIQIPAIDRLTSEFADAAGPGVVPPLVSLGLGGGCLTGDEPIARSESEACLHDAAFCAEECHVPGRIAMTTSAKNRHTRCYWVDRKSTLMHTIFISQHMVACHVMDFYGAALHGARMELRAEAREEEQRQTTAAATAAAVIGPSATGCCGESSPTTRAMCGMYM